MNRSLGFLNFPTLPKDKRPYDDHLQEELRQHDHDIIAQLNSQVQSIGAILKSAATINLTNPIHIVSGTATIEHIAPPQGFTGPVWLIANGSWSVVTTGNIRTAFTASIGHSYEFIFDGSKWAPAASTGTSASSSAFVIGVSASPFLVPAGITSYIAASSSATGNCIIQLPPATGSATAVNVKKVDANPTLIMVEPFGTDTIDGAPVQVNSVQNNSYTFVDYAPGLWGIF